MGEFPQTAQAVVSFVLDPLYVPENCEVVYFLQDNDSREIFQAAGVDLIDLAGPTGVTTVTKSFELVCNYPNPFNPSTTIPVAAAKRCMARLEIYSADGRRVLSWYTGVLPQGYYTFCWNARNAQGEEVPNGVYLVRLSDEAGMSATRQIMLLK